MRIAVVGSGPAGVACAKALVRRGLSVTLFDAGETLPEDRREIVDGLAIRPRREWDPILVDRITENPTINQKIPQKLAFGSDFVYGGTRWHSPFSAAGLSITPTYARGGYSTVWGGAVMPAATEDLTGWPITRADLDPYYETILADMPISGEPGRLDDLFPWFTANVSPLPMPRQARELLVKLEKVATQLAWQNIMFGKSRLAVRANDTGAGRGCISCGLCLSGCPLGCIYKTDSDLDALIQSGKLEYRRGALLQSFSETTNGVHAFFVDDTTRIRFDATVDCLFVAAGAINSTRVLLESLGLHDIDVSLKDSQKFLIPMLNLAATETALDDDAPSLPSIFLEAKPAASPEHYVHIQISAVNDMVLQRFGLNRFNRNSIKARLLAPGLKRLMICWGGLHSDYSSTFTMRLVAHGETGAGQLVLRPVINPSAAQAVKSVARSLFRAALQFRSLMLLPALQIGAPGDGNHYGGSFPMRETPRSPLETDKFGRPTRHRRVYVVDSTVFPSIPATTLALTIMANAYRIGTEAPLTTAK